MNVVHNALLPNSQTNTISSNALPIGRAICASAKERSLQSPQQPITRKATDNAIRIIMA